MSKFEKAHSEIQCIIGNGHMGTPCEQTDRQTQIKTLPFPTSFVGGKICLSNWFRLAGQLIFRRAYSS